MIYDLKLNGRRGKTNIKQISFYFCIHSFIFHRLSNLFMSHQFTYPFFIGQELRSACQDQFQWFHPRRHETQLRRVHSRGGRRVRHNNDCNMAFLHVRSVHRQPMFFCRPHCSSEDMADANPCRLKSLAQRNRRDVHKQDREAFCLVVYYFCECFIDVANECYFLL